MIAIDTSALMALLLAEPASVPVRQAIEQADGLCMSAATLAEAMIVAERRRVGPEMVELVEGLGIEIVALTASDARVVAGAYRDWGKGRHPAGLNFGDCFAYALARQRNCPLLHVGADFAGTDARPAIPVSRSP